ncbi:MAG: undecaprenyl diphosphate synthase family protein, partial [Firmicutes bacterium]|nr:undecaprenyl diphosphate synthase family protein [Bacillota bacterium]
PAKEKKAFQGACVEAVQLLAQYDASLLVVGNHRSPMFPKELLPFTTRKTMGRDLIRVNFLVNYDWQWDLFQACTAEEMVVGGGSRLFKTRIASSNVSRVDLIVRWGGRRRLSGLLPVQSVYADFYVLDDLWPDYRPEHFIQALEWYDRQDITLGG